MREMGALAALQNGVFEAKASGASKMMEFPASDKTAERLKAFKSSRGLSTTGGTNSYSRPRRPARIQQVSGSMELTRRDVVHHVGSGHPLRRTPFPTPSSPIRRLRRFDRG